MTASASGVASTLQTGQLIATGMRPFTGSTSNSNRAPQEHWTLTFILLPWIQKHDTRRIGQVKGRSWRAGLHVAITEHDVAAKLIVIVAGRFAGLRKEQ